MTRSTAPQPFITPVAMTCFVPSRSCQAILGEANETSVLMPPALKYPGGLILRIHPDKEQLLAKAAQELGVRLVVAQPFLDADADPHRPPALHIFYTLDGHTPCVPEDDMTPLIERFQQLDVDGYVAAQRLTHAR